jgi:hypothetical protein
MTMKRKAQASPCQKSAKPKGYSEFIDQFWNEVFSKCRGTLPNRKERKRLHELSDRAALILYRERKPGRTLTVDKFIEGLRLAGEEMTAEEFPEAGMEVVA